MTLSSFKLFIAEKKEQDSDLGRIINTIEKRMPQLLNSRIYRFGGKDGIEQGKSGPAYLYFFGKGKAFRVRTKSGAIVGFDVWTKYTLDGAADYTLHTDGLSVAVIAKELKAIAQLIKSPKEGKVPVSESVEAVSYELTSELFEAKGVSPEEFLKLAQKDLGDGEVQSVTFDQIVKIARDNNVAVPNKKYLDAQKVGRGRWSLIPGGGGSSEGGEETKVSGVEVKGDSKDGKPGPTLFIKVTAQDPVSKKFLSAKDSKEAQALYKQIQGTMNPNAKPSEEEMRDVDTLYGHLYQLVTMACNNKLRSLLIYGGPGTGKTYTIMQAVKEAGLSKGKDFIKISGKITSTELYKTLFMFRKGGLVLFDDCDSMWGDKDSSNLLKAALDTSPVREISLSTAQMKNVSKMSDEAREEYNDQVDKFLAGKPAEEEEDEDDDGEGGGKKKDKLKFPSVFDFKGRVVFISNLAKDKFDSAIMSRSAKIDMSLTPQETLKRMRSILPNLGGTDVSLDKKEELIEVLLDLHGKKMLDAVTMREFIKGLDIVRSGAPNWKDLVQYA